MEKYWRPWFRVGEVGEILGIGFSFGEMMEMLHKPGFRVETGV